MKKFIAFLLFLIICAGVVFYFGWIQFAVPVDKYGVMVSKTGGIYPKVITHEQFMWRPERVLPTNVKLYFFDAAPYTSTETVSGELPSAKIYSAQLEEKPDFSYSVTVSVSLNVKPESLVPLFEHTKITDQDGLNSYLKQKCAEVVKLTCDALLAQKKIDGAFIAELSALPAFFDIEIAALSVDQSRIPDIRLYNLARESYNNYRSEVSAAMTSLAQEHARSAMKATTAMEQLEKLGELLEKYPALLQLLSKSDSPSSVMKEINSFFGTD
jgi:hypothetical protein